MSRRALMLLAAASAQPSALGCADCRARNQSMDAAPSAGPSASPPPEVGALPPSLEPLKWQAQDHTRTIGVPAGCRPVLPIRHAKLPAGEVRFASARSEITELALALAARGMANVSRTGLVGVAASKVRPLPWFELDRPPVFDRTPRGWVAAYARTVDGEAGAPVLWSEFDKPLPLASGDQLAVADVLCHGATCAVLTTLAKAAAAPGATVHLGVPGPNAIRVDVEADPAVGWLPLAFTSFDGREARVALKAPAKVAFWNVTKERTQKLSELPSEFGVYDVSTAATPLIATPGANPLERCKAEFPIRIVGPGGKINVINAQTTPESLVLRALDRGALVLWVAPVSCSNTERTVVHAALVDTDGVLTGSVMSVADATGFSAATRGSELALWLRTAEGLSFVQAHCDPKAAAH